MKLPKRFTLSSLLLLVTITALLLGYTQWRKRWLQSEVAKLNADADGILRLDDGQAVMLRDGWFWPTVVNHAAIYIRKADDGSYSVNGKKLNGVEIKQYFQTMTDRLNAIGVTEVSYGVVRNRRVPGQVERTISVVTFQDGFESIGD